MVRKLKNAIARLRHHYKRRQLARKNIFIHPNTFIAQSAVIDTRLGGTITIGEGTEILDGVLILSYGGDIKIGKRCSINPYNILYGHGGLTIGDDVLIAGASMIIPNNHKYQDLNQTISKQGSTNKGIIIQDNVWIAHGCSILDGVLIESGAIIAAGAVVNKNVSMNTIVGGIPAKKIKDRNETAH
jgi:acetyltransferase-like isoleucine patch superfamily enzyme